jgi:hypothetical protein
MQITTETNAEDIIFFKKQKNKKNLRYLRRPCIQLPHHLSTNSGTALIQPKSAPSKQTEKRTINSTQLADDKPNKSPDNFAKIKSVEATVTYANSIH